jgi:hypothetical protein
MVEEVALKTRRTVPFALYEKPVEILGTVVDNSRDIEDHVSYWAITLVSAYQNAGGGNFIFDHDEDGDGDIDGHDIEQVSELGEDVDGDGDIDIPESKQQEIKNTDKQTDKKKVSASGYRDWSPREKYEDHHDAAIKKYMSEGWSHREAERLANAHDAPTNFYDALKSRVKPTQPSEKMLAHMKAVAGTWLRNADRKTSESAEAKKNPIKHASVRALTAHEDAIGDFKSAYDSFLGSDEVKDLRGRARHQAIQAFKNKWEASNPSHREGVISAADAGKIFHQASEERKKFRQEGEQNIVDAGKINPEGMSTASEFSTTAAGGLEGMTSQGAAQMAGGTQEEDGGYTSATVKDPSMVFAERNPEYVQHLKTKLASKLKPEQANRFSAINSFKKGNK